MAQVLIRELDQETVTRLKLRAKQNGRSFEAELRKILNDTASESSKSPLEFVKEMRELFKGRTFDDSTDLIREDRDR